MTQPTKYRFDLSTWFLVGVNALTIAAALHQHWCYPEMLWIYWSQSMVIGLFAAIRAGLLRRFTTRALTTDGGFARPTRSEKVGAVIFFTFIYGTFHLIYLLFLFGIALDLSRQDVPGMLACVGLFTVNHFFSFIQKRKLDQSDTPSIDGILGFAFLRILPMHLTLIIGLMFRNRATGFLVTFLLLKTALDVLMHCIERRRERVEQP